MNVVNGAEKVRIDVIRHMHAMNSNLHDSESKHLRDYDRVLGV